jgi:hypothetical protein
VSRTSVIAAIVGALLLLPSSAVLAGDRDDDLLRDVFERRHGVTSPDSADTDGDGVVDSAEDDDGDQLGNRGEQRYGLDPGSPDTDGDGVPDGLEDHDGDGRSNADEQDQRALPADLRPSLERAAADISRHAPTCGARDGVSALNTCHFGDRDSEITVALVGDSKATMYLPPAIDVAKSEGWHLVTLLKGRCSPVLQTMPRYQRRLDDGATCSAWRREALTWLRRHEPDLIVLVFSDDYTLVDPRDRKLNEEDELRALREGITATMAELPSASQVVLLADAPKSTLNAVNCLKRDPSDMSACITRATPLSAARVNAMLRDTVTDSGGAYRTLEDRICPYEPCPLVQGDVLVYRDKSHLTVTFTKLLAPSLHAELAPLLAAAEVTNEPTVVSSADPRLAPDPGPWPSAEATEAPA